MNPGLSFIYMIPLPLHTGLSLYLLIHKFIIYTYLYRVDERFTGISLVLQIDSYEFYNLDRVNLNVVL